MPLIKFTSGSTVTSPIMEPLSPNLTAKMVKLISGSGLTNIHTSLRLAPPSEEMEHTGLTGGTCPACLAMRATRHMATDFNFIHEPDCAGLVGGWVMVTDPEPKTETVTINGLPYHRLIATDAPSEGMAGKADEVMKGILDGTLSRPKVKQIGDAVAERTKKDSGGDALGGAIGRSTRHGSFMERRTPYSD